MDKKQEKEWMQLLGSIAENQKRLVVVLKQMSDELYRMLKEIKALLE